MTRTPVALVVLAALVSPELARAERPAAYVDEVAAFGGADPADARVLVDDVVRRAGYRPAFRDDRTPPCGDQPACVADRARAAGAALGLRVTVAEVAGQTVASLTIVEVGATAPRRHVAEGEELAALAGALAAPLAELVPATGERRTAAWIAAGTAVLLGAGGAVATWRARDLRAEFFADHLDEDGDVIGISPADAEAEEARARRWSIAGAILLAGAATAGVTATVLFVRTPDGRGERPGGVAITGRF